MKILKKDGTYRKVSNDFIADNLVRTMGWEYSSRTEWKQNVRDVKKVEPKTEEQISLHEKTKARRAKNHSKIKAKQHI